MPVCKYRDSNDEVTMSMYKGETGPVTIAVLCALAVLGSPPPGEGQPPCLLLLDRGTGATSQ